MIELSLPYPPSVNTYYRHITKGKLAGRTLISEKGREYRETVKAQIGAVDALRGRLALSIVLYPPDRRRRDIDNVLKALLDSLTHAGVWEDDSQIKSLSIVMTETLGGLAGVQIEAMDV